MPGGTSSFIKNVFSYICGLSATFTVRESWRHRQPAAAFTVLAKALRYQIATGQAEILRAPTVSNVWTSVA
jgi:hypothetical protein